MTDSPDETDEDWIQRFHDCLRQTWILHEYESQLRNEPSWRQRTLNLTTGHRDVTEAIDHHARLGRQMADDPINQLDDIHTLKSMVGSSYAAPIVKWLKDTADQHILDALPEEER